MLVFVFYRWQSGPLTGGQEYRFAVRIATAPWPEGIETRNTSSRAVTANAAVPTAPVLAAQCL